MANKGTTGFITASREVAWQTKAQQVSLQHREKLHSKQRHNRIHYSIETGCIANKGKTGFITASRQVAWQIMAKQVSLQH